MSKRTIAIVAGIIVLLVVGGAAAVVVAPSNEDKTSTQSSTTNSPESEGRSQTTESTQNESSNDSEAVSATKVDITNFAYSPATIKIKVGDTVTWTNNDTTRHDVMADEESSDAPASELLSKGQSYSFTFKKAGTYTYHCSPHPNMTGTVIVE